MDLKSLHADEALQGNLKRALYLLNQWLSKNVGSAEHTKALKMQKLILIESVAQDRYQKAENGSRNILQRDERLMAANYRLIQLVELGAKTVAYKKSKQGGKLAMRDIAE